MAGELLINPFDTAGYDLATMTQAVNIIPNTYGRVRQLGLFAPDPVTTRTIIVEELNGVLSLLASQPLGAPPPRQSHPKAKMRSFIIPHIPLEDVIKAEDLHGVREPGGINQKMLETTMMKHLGWMRGSHAITEEHLMMGAVKGIIYDADGSTVMYNLYTEFGISAKVVDFALDSDATNVADKCREVKRHIEDNLKGDVMSGVRCLCDETFFDDLIEHDSVKGVYDVYAARLAQTDGEADPRKGFPFGGIIFEEYRGTATGSAGSAVPFIASGAAHFFPVGTMDTFKIHYAPANYLETVGQFGQPIYAKQTMEPKGRWVELNTESNLLPLCRRPAVLVKGTNT